MHPDKENHLSPNGSSPDHQPPGGTMATPTEECGHTNAENSGKEPKERPNNEDLPPNTSNSATMTCPEYQCWNWPPMGMYPYPYNGAFCYPPPPPYIFNTSNLNFQYPNVPLHPPYCNNVNATSSGVSVASNPSNHVNTSGVQAHSNHILMQPNQNLYHPIAYPYPPLYPPNHNNMFLPSSFGLPIMHAGHTLGPNHNLGTNRAQSRNCLCSNCSREIIPSSVIDESNIEELINQTPLNATSFTDSMGRVWKCSSIKPRKVVISKVKVPAENNPTVARLNYATLAEGLRKKSVNRTRVVSPSLERPTTSRDDGVLPIKKKRIKTRIRKIGEATNVTGKTHHTSPPSSPKLKQSSGQKPTSESDHTNKETCSSGNTTSHPKSNRKETSLLSDLSECKTGEGQESVPHNNPPKKLQPASPKELDNKQDDSKNKPHVREKDAMVNSTNEETTKQHAPQQSSVENSVVSGSSTSSKHTKCDGEEKTLEIHKKASCNDYLKNGVNKKETLLLPNQCSKELKDEDFWSTSSSSSSGTYDDSEAFDSFKLLNEAMVSSEAIRQMRQRSRDRLFRRKLAGFVKVTNAQSEEGMKKRRRTVSPRPKVADEKPKEQILVDTSKLRITEETPKRFIVESKDGATTSQNSMTITVQADVPRPSACNVCEFCSSGGQVGTDMTCTCHLPPCQRPQWQAPPCPANEIHGTPVHHCHNISIGRATMQAQSHSQRHRHANALRNELESGETPFMRDTPMIRELEVYQHARESLPNYGLVAPWNQRNVDRPREENRHPHYIPPRPSTERLDNVRRDHSLPTNRTRRWHTQPETMAETRSNRQAQEMLRIQIPNSFPRYRPYEYGRNHNEEPMDNHEGIEESLENRARNSIDINIFRSNGGVRRLGTVRRVVRCNSPRERDHHSEETAQQDEDPESNLDFYRRPRSAITVSKTNYFSPRNRKLEEEVQRIQSANYMPDAQNTSTAKEEDSEYVDKSCCEEEQEFEDGEKADCEYDEVDGRKEDQDSRQDIDDEED